MNFILKNFNRAPWVEEKFNILSILYGTEVARFIIICDSEKEPKKEPSQYDNTPSVEYVVSDKYSLPELRVNGVEINDFIKSISGVQICN